MEINCNQFEGLITFYLDGDLSKSLKEAFEKHLKTCPACSMKFNIIKSIIGDIKGAYDKILISCEQDANQSRNYKTNNEDISSVELSAYIDNELSDENNIKIRRNIIAKPSIRTKLEKMYKLKKLLSESFNEHKNKLKTDYSKEVMRTINSDISSKQVCLHCLLFVFVVFLAVVCSIWVIIHSL